MLVSRMAQIAPLCPAGAGSAARAMRSVRTYIPDIQLSAVIHAASDINAAKLSAWSSCMVTWLISGG